MPDGKLPFKSPSTRWHIQANKVMSERIYKQSIQTRKVKVEQLRPTEWRIIVLNAPFYYCVLSVLAFE